MHSKGNDKQDEKATLWMGENICKWSNWQRINHLNIWAAHAAQYQKNKQPNKKMDLNRKPKHYNDRIWKGAKEPLDEGETGEWKGWLKTL